MTKSGIIIKSHNVYYDILGNLRIWNTIWQLTNNYFRIKNNILEPI